jgi:ribonuclease G
MERSLRRAAVGNKDRRMTVRLHPEVALYLLEEEPGFLKALAKQTGIDLEVRDDPMMKLDELKLMSQPAGRDVTESYLVA